MGNIFDSRGKEKVKHSDIDQKTIILKDLKYKLIGRGTILKK